LGKLEFVTEVRHLVKNPVQLGARPVFLASQEAEIRRIEV
jgi:hypothetical protein